jgi:hypothetical protein
MSCVRTHVDAPISPVLYLMSTDRIGPSKANSCASDDQLIVQNHLLEHNSLLGHINEVSESFVT